MGSPSLEAFGNWGDWRTLFCFMAKLSDDAQKWFPNGVRNADLCHFYKIRNMFFGNL